MEQDSKTTPEAPSRSQPPQPGETRTFQMHDHPPRSGGAGQPGEQFSFASRLRWAEGERGRNESSGQSYFASKLRWEGRPDAGSAAVGKSTSSFSGGAKWLARGVGRETGRVLDEQMDKAAEASQNYGAQAANKADQQTRKGAVFGLQHGWRHAATHDARMERKAVARENKARIQELKDKLYEAEHGRKSPGALRRERAAARSQRFATQRARAGAFGKQTLSRAVGARRADAAIEAIKWLARGVAGLVRMIVTPVVGTVLGAFLFTFGLLAVIGAVVAIASSSIVMMLTGYTAPQADIDTISAQATRLEADLAKQLHDLPAAWEWQHIDEFRFSCDPIGHDPAQLMAYLNVRFPGFEHPQEVAGEVQRLHDARYQLTLHEIQEIRYSEETYTDPITGKETTESVPYRYYILDVTLRTKELEDVIWSSLMPMEGGADLLEWYQVLVDTGGARQEFGSPFAQEWRNRVTSPYGYRLDPLGSGSMQLHRGIDIAQPRGTPILAGLDGRIIYAGYDSYFGNYLILEDDSGRMVKYAHCDRLLAAVGTEVKTGQQIATVGNSGESAGAHLHIETKKDGEYMNPIYSLNTTIEE